MKNMEELELLSIEQLEEKLNNAKRVHYQFLYELDLSNVSKDQQRKDSLMRYQVQMIDYVYGKKICDDMLMKNKS